MSEALKEQVGEAVLDWVKPGMKLGIGTGSTAEAFIRALARKVEAGLDVIGVPTSIRTQKLCNELGVRLTTLDETPSLDLTIDGADEIDTRLNLIKGAGGALLREKIVAAASEQMIVIADESKLVKNLGAFDLPIEINIFGAVATGRAIEKLATRMQMSGNLAVRKQHDGTDFLTDGGHIILDASFGHIGDPEALEAALNLIPGVVENGLFTGLATHAIVAGADGVRIVEPI